MTNQDTHLFTSMSAMARSMGDAVIEARRPLLIENEQLRERLQTVTMLLGCAKTRLTEDHPAWTWIDQAEKSARGG